MSSPGQVPDLLEQLMEFSAAAGENDPVSITDPTANPDVARTELPSSARDWLRLTAGGRLLGLLRSQQLARWCAEGPGALRAVVEALAVEWDAHAPQQGRCPACGQPAPCPARGRMTSMLTIPPRGRGGLRTRPGRDARARRGAR